jgi:pteridine reductase
MTTNANPGRLDGKAVLVTGAARRIGAAIAQALHGAGANMVLHYRHSAADAEALAASLNRDRPGSAITVQADLLDVTRLASLIEVPLATFGRLDVLVNNASSFYRTPLGTITPQQWDDLIGSNVRAPLFLSQAAAPALRRTAGLILNLADIHALRPLREHPVYCIAKAGLVMATRSLARELGPEVRVNAIAPGPVVWPEEESSGRKISAELKADIIHRTALKRIGTPEDIARAALYFATAAPYVTGQILAVDGGRSLGF